MNAVSDIKPMGNAEAEAAVLTALMLDNRQIDAVADKLSPDDFAEAFYGHAYSCILKEHGLGRSANPATLKPYFDDAGYQALAGLTGSATILAAKDCAAQIVDLAKRRRLIEGLTGIIANAQAWGMPIEELADDADTAIADALKENDGSNTRSAAQCIGEVLASFDNAETGVRCHAIQAFDSILGPIKPKQFVVLAGRPGMGKTATALSYAVGAARAGHGVLFVSLEMSSEELGGRMAADMAFDSRGQVPHHVIASARVTVEQGRSIARAFDEAGSLPLQIEDLASVTIGRLNMLVRRHKRRFLARGQKLELVIVDYLQLCRPDHREQSPYAAISEVSRGLKGIAKGNEVGLMALAQLSREVEKRQDKRPQLSDLRDSGQIEQDADAVLFLMRPEYYVAQEEPEIHTADHLKWQTAMDAVRGHIEFICAKRRNGLSGKSFGRFFGAFQAVR